MNGSSLMIHLLCGTGTSTLVLKGILGVDCVLLRHTLCCPKSTLEAGPDAAQTADEAVGFLGPVQQAKPVQRHPSGYHWSGAFCQPPTSIPIRAQQLPADPQKSLIHHINYTYREGLSYLYRSYFYCLRVSEARFLFTTCVAGGATSDGPLHVRRSA